MHVTAFLGNQFRNDTHVFAYYTCYLFWSCYSRVTMFFALDFSTMKLFLNFI